MTKCDPRLCAGEECEHDFNKLVTENLSELRLGTAPDKLNKVFTLFMIRIYIYIYMQP